MSSEQNQQFENQQFVPLQQNTYVQQSYPNQTTFQYQQPTYYQELNAQRVYEGPQTVSVVQGESQQVGTQIHEGVAGNRQLVSTTVTNYQTPGQTQTVVQQFQQPQYVQTIVQQPIQQSMVQTVEQVPQPRTEFLGTTTTQQPHVKGESRIEYVPYETTHIDYQAVQKVETIPHEKKWTDYYAVEHQTEYIPHVYTDKYVDYIPQEKVYYEYQAQERQQQRVEYQAIQKQIVHGGQTAVSTVSQKPQDTVESRIIGYTPVYNIQQQQFQQTVPIQQSQVVVQPITTTVQQLPIQQSQVIYQPQVQTYLQPTSTVIQQPMTFVQPVTTTVQQPISYYQPTFYQSQFVPSYIQPQQQVQKSNQDIQKSVQSQQNQQGILEKMLN